MAVHVPKEFFITSGHATSPVSDLNAFDLALMKAHISEQNLVAVSSVIPDGAREVEIREIPMGTVTFCVLSQMRGYSGENLAAGIAYTYRKDGHGGYVAEGHLHGNAEDLRCELKRKMEEMSRIRGVEFGEIHYRVEELSVPQDMYGCCISSLVFCDFH
ncbi:MAG: pyruvoyl-dependent arginine decarboxylase [archaeon]|nr:pyruvoyl-dependent arginine decarboxylase [archaeon]